MKEFLYRSVGNIAEMRLRLGLPPKGKTLEALSLNETQQKQVFFDLGRDLGSRIHVRSGQGFGWVDMKTLLATGKVRAPFSSWHEFLTATFDQHTAKMEQVEASEKKSGKFVTLLSQPNRDLMNILWNKRPKVRIVLEDRKDTLDTITQPRLLHGDLHVGSIIVNDAKKYAGLKRFIQPVLGDPVDDLAYLSVMPRGDVFAPSAIEGWKSIQGNQDIEERLHVYRLWEAYRKIFTRYTKHHYLEDHPEPLTIAQQELGYFKI